MTTWATSDNLAQALKRVTTSTGVAASDWTLFRGALFGRDSLIVALDLLEWYPDLAATVIRSLAALQGTRYDQYTEEEPGKIHHEYRTLYHSGVRLDGATAELIAAIARERNIGSPDGFIYYGTVDATPQFVRLVTAYVRRYGDAVLDEVVMHNNGHYVSIAECLRAAVAWTARRLDNSALGLLEFQRTNPGGIKWHVLRDGSVSYVHTDGRMASTAAPVASLDVQGLAYDALLEAADLWPDDPQAAMWRHLAAVLRLRTLLLFWMPEEEYFAQALDHDEEGRPRQMATITALPLELLDTRFFDHLPAPFDRRRLLEGLVRRLYDSDMMTPVGPRMRSLAHAGLLPYADYQGSFTSWPVITNIIARGLARQGFTSLAADLQGRILAGINAVRGCPEFFYLDEAGRIAVQSARQPDGAYRIPGTNEPELNQAWTVSAAIRAARAKSPGKPAGTWQDRLAHQVLDQEATDSQPEVMTAFIDRPAGQRAEARYLQGQGYGHEVKNASWLQEAAPA